MANNFIGYSGVVKIKKYRKGKLRRIQTLHNAGTWNLLNLICNALGSPLSIQEREFPHYLDLMYDYKLMTGEADDEKVAEGTLSALRSALSPNLPVISTLSVDTANPGLKAQPLSDTSVSCSVTFRGMLTSANWVTVQSSDQSSENKNNPAPLYFVLKAQNAEAGENTILAVVEFEGMTWQSFSIATDEVYIIDWTMTFSNKAEGTSSGGNNS